MITIPAVPRFLADMGGSAVAIGLSFSVMSVGRFLVNIPAGMLSERIGRKKVVIAGGIIIAVFATLSGTSTNIPTFLLYRFLIGIGSAMVITVTSVIATDLSTVDNRGRVLGMLSGMQLIVGIGTPAIGGFIAEFASPRAAFYVSGVGVMFFSAWALARLPETRPRDALESQRSVAGPKPRFATLGLLRDPNFALVCILGFATFFLRGGASLSLIPLYGDRIVEASPGLIGLLFAAASGIHGALVYPTGAAADRWGRKPVIVPAGIFVGLAMFVFPFGTTTLTFAAAFIFLHFAVAFGGQAPNAYLGDISPAGQRGVAFGLYRTFGDTAEIVGPLIATGLADAVSFHAAFFFGGGLWLAALLLFARYARETAGPVARQKAAREAAASVPGPATALADDPRQ